ncbi:MAG: PilZ domain-containing protein [Paenibacillaceae bacterium]
MILLPDHLPEVCGNIKRHYIRIQVPGLAMKIHIVAIGNRVVKSGTQNVLVLNIGPGGLRFTTGLQIPANRDVKISLQTTLTGIRFETEGYIVWREAVENMYEYGMEFDMSTLHRSFLIRLLNYLYVKLYPEHQKVHQYYAHFTQCYLDEQRSKINYTM